MCDLRFFVSSVCPHVMHSHVFSSFFLICPFDISVSGFLFSAIAFTLSTFVLFDGFMSLSSPVQSSLWRLLMIFSFLCIKLQLLFSQNFIAILFLSYQMWHIYEFFICFPSVDFSVLPHCSHVNLFCFFS